MRIMIATPHRNEIKGVKEASMARLISACPTGHEYVYVNIECAIMSDGRNMMFDEAIQQGCDHLLFVDSDMEFPADGLTRLLAHQKDVVGGVYYSRKHPFNPICYNFRRDDGRISSLSEIPEALFQLEVIGTGFLLVSRRVIELFNDNLGRHPYMTPWIKGLVQDTCINKPFNLITLNSGSQISEDVSFCMRLIEMGVELWADPTIRLGHMRTDIIYKEYWDAAKQQARAVVHAPVDVVVDGIPGWSSNEEHDLLAQAANVMDTVVELGSWKGRSADVLMRSCPGTVFCVDTWAGTVEFASGMSIDKQPVLPGRDLFQNFAANISGHERFGVLRMDSVEAARFFPDKSVDMVFIDASHSYEGCLADIRAWLPKVKRLICGHDFREEWPGVEMAVREVFDADFSVCESIWYKYLDGKEV